MKSLKHGYYGLFGIISASLLTVAYVLGAILRPGYSSMRQAISELIEAGAPNKLLLDSILFGFHGLVIPFAYGLHKSINKGKGSKLAPLLLGGAGLIGVILTAFFPCDPGCVPGGSTRGMLHIFIAIPMGFMILFSILFFSYRFKEDKKWEKFATYSKITFFVGLILGISSVFFAKSAIGGLLERLISLSYQQWYVVVGINMLRGLKK